MAQLQEANSVLLKYLILIIHVNTATNKAILQSANIIAVKVLSDAG